MPTTSAYVAGDERVAAPAPLVRSQQEPENPDDAGSQAPPSDQPMPAPEPNLDGPVGPNTGPAPAAPAPARSATDSTG